MQIHIDNASERPVYLQIIDAVIAGDSAAAGFARVISFLQSGS